MDLAKFTVPYLSAIEIRRLADLQRIKYWGEAIPVDIEKILTEQLKISIIPSPQLHDNFGVDSFISSRWDYIYVDNDHYLDDVSYRRVRFSLAHEFGHLILHRELYSTWNISSMEDYYALYEAIPVDQYSFLETQANKFAGYFLVPRDALNLEFQKLKLAKKEILASFGLAGTSDLDLFDYMAESLAETFNVSTDAMRVCGKTIE